MAEINKERQKMRVRGRLRSHLSIENTAMGKGERDTGKHSRNREGRKRRK